MRCFYSIFSPIAANICNVFQDRNNKQKIDKNIQKQNKYKYLYEIETKRQLKNVTQKYNIKERKENKAKHTLEEKNTQNANKQLRKY